MQKLVDAKRGWLVAAEEKARVAHKAAQDAVDDPVKVTQQRKRKFDDMQNKWTQSDKQV